MSCDGSATQSARANSVGLGREVATKTFSIGDPQQFAEHGVHEDFRMSHGVWIVTRDSASGTMLVVLSAQPPGVDGMTHFAPAIGRFRCPVSGSRFTRDGLLSGSSGTATHSLERLRLEFRDGELHVVPSRRYAQEDNDWSNQFSLFILDSETHPDLATDEGANFDRRPRLRPTHSLFGGD
ncbi:MAG: hypothetical protein AAGB29_03125 [Planctomycetota bacterium]